MIAPQSSGTNWPTAFMLKPAGVCIQLFTASIQNADITVPTATIDVAAMCNRGPTLSRPNSMIPRNPASRKKADNTS